MQSHDMVYDVIISRLYENPSNAAESLWNSLFWCHVITVYTHLTYYFAHVCSVRFGKTSKRIWRLYSCVKWHVKCLLCCFISMLLLWDNRSRVNLSKSSWDGCSYGRPCEAAHSLDLINTLILIVFYTNQGRYRFLVNAQRVRNADCRISNASHCDRLHRKGT